MTSTKLVSETGVCEIEWLIDGRISATFQMDSGRGQTFTGDDDGSDLDLAWCSDRGDTIATPWGVSIKSAKPDYIADPIWGDAVWLPNRGPNMTIHVGEDGCHGVVKITNTFRSSSFDFEESA